MPPSWIIIDKIIIPKKLNVSAVLTTVNPVTLIALAAVKKASENERLIPDLCEIGKYKITDEMRMSVKYERMMILKGDKN